MADDDADQARAALERFVTDNDELLQLEERIGKFNIFDALRIERVEIRHSNFLACLLDPAESHGQGPLFLRAVLMDILRQSPPALRPFSPIELDGAELRGVRILREHRNIDILIECKEPPFVIAVENKVYSGEHSGQLQKYKQVVAEEFKDVKSQFVYLTREGDEPTDDQWTVYSYRDIHDTLQRVRRMNAASIGDDVLTFLDHYLNLIGSRFMDDARIDELCQRIFKNHRQALELIWEKAGGAGSGLLADIHEMMASDPRWYIFHRTSKRIDFVPAAWAEWLPPISSRPRSHPKAWLKWYLYVGDKSSKLAVRVGPSTHPTIRANTIERLKQDPDAFGFRLGANANESANRWTNLFSKNVSRWNEDASPELDDVSERLEAELSSLLEKTRGVEAALRPILAGWKPNNEDA